MFRIQVDDDITLHLAQEHHAQAIFNLLNNSQEHLAEFEGEFDKTLEAVHKRTLRAKEVYANNGTLINLITYQGQPAGMINLYHRNGSLVSGAEIGYWLGKDFVGKGIVTRATKTLTDYAFTQWDVNRVFFGSATNNPRSYAIAERLGFTLEGTIRQNERINEEWIDHRVYAMLKQDWTLPQNPPILCCQIEDNLDIRLIEKRHAEALFNLCDRNREHIGKWLGWIDNTNSVDDTMGFIEASIKQYGENDGFQAGIWQNNQIIGMIGYLYWNFEEKHTEIGYWLSQDETGRGIMTKCSHVLTDYAFNTLNLNQVVIRCGVDNDKSCNVAKRLGFKHEGVQLVRSEFRDEQVYLNRYAILAEDWE